jgi:hypothetical protein
LNDVFEVLEQDVFGDVFETAPLTLQRLSKPKYLSTERGCTFCQPGSDSEQFFQESWFDCILIGKPGSFKIKYSTRMHPLGSRVVVCSVRANLRG